MATTTMIKTTVRRAVGEMMTMTAMAARETMAIYDCDGDDDLAGLRAKIKIIIFRIRAGIGPKPAISLRKWQSGPSPGSPRAKEKIKNNFKHSQDDHYDLQRMQRKRIRRRR